MYSIKPIDRELIKKSASETGLLFSVENHSIIGGLGSAIADVLCEECPKMLTKIGINDTFGRSGRSEDLLKYYKLDAVSIAKQIKTKYLV